MKRLARVALFVAFSLAVSSTLAWAQRRDPPPKAPAADQSRFYAEFTTGPTFGHHSSGSVGLDAGATVARNIEAFFEAGHIANAGTQDLDNRAAVIANFVGSSFSALYKVNYFSFGVRYHWEATPMWHPYVAFGVGAAHVRSETVLNPPDPTIQFGSDLNGSLNKGFVTLAGGVTRPFAKRYFADLSLRYGRVLAKTSEIENDTGINTGRLQFGVGIKF